MTAMHTKLLRDLSSLWAQVLTIAVVVAIGVAGFVGMFSVHQSLLQARDGFYQDNRLADVFAQVRRAPHALLPRIAAMDGVAEVKAEVAFDAQLDLPGVGPPVTGRFIGLNLPEVHAAEQGLNRLTLKRGRWPQAGAALEALVSDRFASVRGLQPGDAVSAILNGKRERIHVVGTVASPEYVFAFRGGVPDDMSYGIWWIDERRMRQIFDMEGAFNQLALALAPGRSPQRVIDELDRMLQDYGAIGAVARDRLPSAQVVNDELAGLRVMGTVLPAIFLAVAMFVLNVVLSRQVATQRGQIAALKALGYGDGAIAWHYIQFGLVIAGAGVLAGLALSLPMGRSMLGLYDQVFRFNELRYATSATLVGGSILIAGVAACAGVWSAIRAVVTLSPAQAMQPPAPPAYRASWFERLGLGRKVSMASLMVMRNLERRPLRALFTIMGIALAVALQITGAFWQDAIEHVIDTQFRRAQQGDVLVSFHPPVPVDVAHDLRRLPGVLDAEAYRSEPVRVSLGGRSEDTVLVGLRHQAQLMRVVDEQRGPLLMPSHGVVISALLAKDLQAQVGDTLKLEFRLWSRKHIELEVVEIAHTMLGKQAYMDLYQMNRLSGDGQGVSAAALLLDRLAMDEFWPAVKAAPTIHTVFDKTSTLQQFRETTARAMSIFSGVLTLFAVAMAVGIIYNAARIALSERAWELASLRVLGMTRAEVSVLLLAELGLALLIALPLGAVAGWGLAELLMALMAPEAIDFPVVIAPSTYASAALIVLAAGVASALLVRRQVDRLDLVAVLKVRE